MRFYLTTRCESCDNDMHYGPVLSTLDDHRGLPVIDADLLAQTRVDCDRCGTRHYFGDLDVFVEPSDVEDEADETEEDDDGDDDK